MSNVYLVCADHNGAYCVAVPTKDLSDYKFSWIAAFSIKIMAQDYVSYLNQTRAPEHLISLQAMAR